MSLDLLRSRKLSAANTNVTGIRNPAVPIPIEYLIILNHKKKKMQLNFELFVVRIIYR